jgi:hypothetical protein
MHPDINSVDADPLPRGKYRGPDTQMEDGKLVRTWASRFPCNIGPSPGRRLEVDVAAPATSSGLVNW